MKAPYLVQLDDVRMSDFLENFDLTRDPLNIFLIMNLLFLQNFDSDLNTTAVSVIEHYDQSCSYSLVRQED